MDLLDIARTALFVVTGTRFRWLWIGLVAFSFVSLLGHFVEKREAAKKVFLAKMAKIMADDREARFVGAFYTTDWISPFTHKPHAIIAVPFDYEDVPAKPHTKEAFVLSVISYGDEKPHIDAAEVDCKARTQDISFDDKSVLVTEAADSDDKKYPRWIPALCGDWSSEKRALREREQKRRRRAG